MQHTPTAEEARQSLRDHVAAKGAELHELYGPRIGWKELNAILENRAYVRYPCEIVFFETGLQPGEFAHPEPKGSAPEEGFIMRVHPFFATQPNSVPPLVLYQLVLVNYGEFISHEDAEAFGANALGLPQEDYYECLCAAADLIANA